MRLGYRASVNFTRLPVLCKVPKYLLSRDFLHTSVRFTSQPKVGRMLSLGRQQEDAAHSKPADSFSSPELPLNKDDLASTPAIFKIGIWVTVLTSVIGIFYGLVFVASGELSLFLKDRITFTRKDFVPYSERRRLETELRAEQESLPGGSSNTETRKEQIEFRKSLGPSTIYGLMPSSKQ